MLARDERMLVAFDRLLHNIDLRRHTNELHTPTILDPKEEMRVQNAKCFGLLSNDLVHHILAHLIALDPQLHCGTELRARVRETIIDTMSFCRTCSLLFRAFVTDCEAVRLEVAARSCTSATPTNALTAQPFVNQLLLEERSRFDIKVLESAIVSQLCHCTGDHCKGARRTHNLVIQSEAKGFSKLRMTVLGKRKGRVKVAWPTCRGIATSPITNEVVLLMAHHQPIAERTTWNSPRTYGLIRINDQDPDAFAPQHELKPLASARLEAQPATETGVPFDVSIVATSPCGQFVACIHRMYGETASIMETRDTVGTSTFVTVWNVETNASAPIAVLYPKAVTSFSYFRQEVLRRLVYGAWFHLDGTQLVLDVLVQEETRPSGFLMVQSYEITSKGPSLEYEVAFARNRELSIVSDSLVCHQFYEGHHVAASGKAVLVRLQGKIHKDDAAFLGHPFGHDEYHVQQALCYETDLHVWSDEDSPFKNGASVPITDARRDNMNPASEYNDGYLNPCGDTAVLLVQSQALRTLLVEVWVRLSPKGGFARVRRVRILPNGQTPLMAASTIERMHLPHANAFSPCGRYLILVFGGDGRRARPHTSNLELSKSGVYIIDVGATEAEAADRMMVWFPTRPDNTPRDVAWNTAGLWIQTRSGLLLLGV